MDGGKLEHTSEAVPYTAVKNRWVTTEYVLADEPCYFMLETDVVTSDFKALRRFRLFVVNRNDELAYFWQDLGPGTPDIDPFQIIGLWEETVGSCIDLSHHLHENQDTWNKKRQEITGESTLIQDFVDQLEQAHKQLKHQTHSGPSLLRQR